MMRALRFDRVRTRLRGREQRAESSGQMTIEFVVLFPVMLIIALIAFNSMLFLSECAAFDRLFRESVCVFAPSPASEDAPDRTCAQIEGALETLSQKSHLSCGISQSTGSDGLTTFTGTLLYTPSLFGAYPVQRIFDVELPPLEHTVQMAVDVYKPGVLL